MSALQKRLVRLLVVTEIILLGVSLLLVTGYHIQKLRNKSYLFLDATRNDFLLNDQRALLQKVQIAINEHEFTAIAFVGDGGGSPPSRKFFEVQMSLPVLAKPGQLDTEVGRGYFLYSLTPAFFEGFFLWLFLSLVLVIITPRLKNMLSQHIKGEMELAKLREMNEIATGIAHDIRSPLSALQLISGLPDLNREEVREILKETSSRIDSIAQGLLDEFKKELGAYTVEVLSTHPLLSSIVREKKIEYSNVENFELFLDDGESFNFSGNKDELKRIISNIINNAVDSKGQAPIKIRISTGSDNDYVWIEIRDNGKGIPKTVLDKIGKERIKSEKNLSRAGTGIGLLNAYRSLEKMNAKVVIDSTLGVGTTVTLRFHKS
jgi:signal transduction histidine kinase